MFLTLKVGKVGVHLNFVSAWYHGVARFSDYYNTTGYGF